MKYYRRETDDPPGDDISDQDWIIGCVLALFQIAGVVIAGIIIYNVYIYFSHLCQPFALVTLRLTIGLCR